MKLHYQQIGTGRPLIILHGLFGSLDNWRGLAKQLSHVAQVISIDLRNHGRSPHSPQQNYQLMVDDLIELFNDLNIDTADIIGHSIGGKVAMAFSQRYPQHVNKLLVVDMAPRQYQDQHSAIFTALVGLDLSQFSKRSEADNALEQAISDKSIRQFLLMNLAINDGQIRWRINLQALANNYPQLLEAVCHNDKINVQSCFIRGGRSSYIGMDDETDINATFPNSEICTIERAGHWVHAEAPQEFLTKVIQFFDYD